MFEKILQKLKEQRGQNSNVSDRSLEDLAKTLESVITTDETLEKADFSAAIESIDGNINHYTAQAVKNAQKDADDEKKRKKAEEDAEKHKSKSQNQQTNQPDDMPAWAKALMEQNEKLTNSLETLHTEKAASTRREMLQKTFKDKDGNELPEFYTKPILEAFNNTKFEDEDSFNNYLSSIKANNDAFSQQVKENGIKFGTPKKEVEVPEETGETEVLSDARKMVSKQKEESKTE